MIKCTEHLELTYWPNFLDKSKADELYQTFCHLSWALEYYRMFGKIIPSPRLMAWYGDSNVDYQYSGIRHSPLPWTEELLFVKKLIEAKINHPFNAVLANLYRDGRDGMGWHADDEPELGKNPVIASISLGATRRFKFRTLSQPRQMIDTTLSHGSLLVMHGQTQHFWQHAITKTKKTCLPRINLTFRYIHQGN